jgi:D-methionine transport system substrate-binding protein
MGKLAYALLLCLLTGCVVSKPTALKLKVAATAVPHAALLEAVQGELREEGVDLEVVVTDDYNMPNRALVDREVDANFFQHLPFLEEQIRSFHYPILSIAPIEIEPMGLYSQKIAALADLPKGATLSIPHDPTNEGRALLLLEKLGLITLDHRHGLQATILDIISNPQELLILEVDPALLPRTLPEVEASVINMNYALQAGLSSHDALAMEAPDSPYVNVLVVRDEDAKRREILALRAALTSQKMRNFIIQTYHGAILPAF